ncbi:MAG: tRNA (adenosine(37)-N6)-threonylcarbamoyltransferase complex dimerization subunit type 1 TsaB [Abditibacteriales bacterium]|nr:tRNA (adenosine(37)-N6)-threonylcarbamoyltransferase complex dimerization subunit type 1 TsaB [Abditibacteriales bacterium]MDW8365183.1 tRNA (adenosine(37)-N6)-threonylcarbamoyltransferase complex dimerization subunit type 1 TsaB [Abditibacteriales bacterium]
MLVIETSGNTCGVAVSVDGCVQAVRYLEDRSSLSQRIMGLVDETLQAASCAVHDLNGIAVSLGPGSWTGLRIGVTTAKALAQGLRVPLVGVPTFDAAARRMRHAPDQRLFIVAPCRKGEVYVAAYARGQKVQSEYIAKTDDLIQQLREAEGPIALCGDAADELQKALSYQANVGGTFAYYVLVGAADIAHARLTQGDADDLFAVKPIYLAPSQAERVMGVRIE